jgi:hypothetical protein
MALRWHHSLPETGATRIDAQNAATISCSSILLLMSAAGLMIRTLVAMSTEDHGFRAGSVLMTGVELPINRYNARQLTTFYRQAEAALMGLPGVHSVGFASNLPLRGWDRDQPFEIAGDPPVERSPEWTHAGPHHGISDSRRIVTDHDGMRR